MDAELTILKRGIPKQTDLSIRQPIISGSIRAENESAFIFPPPCLLSIIQSRDAKKENNILHNKNTINSSLDYCFAKNMQHMQKIVQASAKVLTAGIVVFMAGFTSFFLSFFFICHF